MSTAHRALILLSPVINVDDRLRTLLREQFPALPVDYVGHHSEVGPYIGEATILITFGVLMTDQVFQAAKRLEWIHVPGSGVDGIIGHPLLPAHVLVTNSRGATSPAMAETALALMFSLARDVPRLVRQQQGRRWQRFAPTILTGKTLTILGVGAVAEALAQRCQALGLRVVGISGSRQSAPHFDRIVPRTALREAAAEADVFVNLAPGTAETRHIVSAGVIAALKPTAYFINIGRGTTVDEPALVAALAAGRIAGAGLDVVEQEPLAADHPLWSLPNVILSPHLGGFHRRFIDDLMPAFAANLRHFLAGERGQMVNVIRSAR